MIIKGKVFYLGIKFEKDFLEIKCSIEYFEDDKFLLQLRLEDILFQNWGLITNIKPNLEFESKFKNLKKITASNNDVYIIADKRNVEVKVVLDSFLKDIKQFEGYRTVILDFDKFKRKEDILENIHLFPIDLNYKLIITQSPKTFLQSELFLAFLRKLQKWIIETKNLLVKISETYNKIEDNLFDTKFLVWSEWRNTVINWKRLIDILEN